MKRSVLYAFCFILTLLTLASVGSPIAYAQNPKIYVLFIWGTADENVLSVTQTSKEKIEWLFTKMAKSYPGGFEMSRIEGEAAHPKNIIQECKRIAQQAGPNDAVLVYALVHGAVVQFPDGKERHALAPLAKSAQDMRLETEGIKRGTIMKILKSSPHRLNMLITDACSSEYHSEKSGRPGLPSDGTKGSVKDLYLLAVLLNASGDLNINSTKPRTPGRPAELARGYSVRNLRKGETTQILEKYGTGSETSLDDREIECLCYGGCVFANSFFEVATRSDYNKSDLNLDSFFKELRDGQHKFYEEWIEYMISKGAGGSAYNQQTQTLTKFDDDSVAVFDDAGAAPSL